MPHLFGRDWTRAELERRAGRADQFGGIAAVTLDEGAGRGVRALEVRTGAGFAFTAIGDRALDVAAASFEGVSLCWHAQNAVAAPAFVDHHGDAWLRTFFGGLFTTCGLSSFGPSGTDRFGPHGLHGRADALPACDLRWETRWDGEECLFEIRGTMRESRVFGPNLRLERLLRTGLGWRHLELHDRVTNEGDAETPHMLLYHCNGGFPLLDEHARLHVSHAGVRARDEVAQRGLAVWDRGAAPQAGFAEQVFIHEPVVCADGRAVVALANPTLGTRGGRALAIHFDPRQLPALFTWRMLGRGTYVMGMEPANCPTIEGRAEADKRRTLPMLQPGESRSYDLEFCVLDGTDAIEGLQRSIAARA